MAAGFSRRRLLRSAAVGGGAGVAGAAFLFRAPRPVAGGFVDDSHIVGHAIRDGRRQVASTDRVRVPVVIVGGGIAGLSAAWHLQRHGFTDFALLELERIPGGNSRAGRNDITAYPWGAHYVPVPDRRIPLVEELFTELGVLRQGRWDEAHLCPPPLDRLFRDGTWRPGLEPDSSSPQAERDQFDRFWERMDYYRHGGEFTLPMRLPGHTAHLDRVSMKAWMVAEGLYHERLRWYVDYACRDDYGCSYEQTSAWAGIHYFAARPEEDEDILTWPEGNGWIVARLLERLRPWVRTAEPARWIRKAGNRLEVGTERATYDCEAVVFAAPSFLAPYLLRGWEAELPLPVGFTYAPWYTANLVIDDPPREEGAPPAWENMLYDSPGLGYVVATHKRPGPRAVPTVWTYYRALTYPAPRVARQELLALSWEERKEEVLRDLATAHPAIRGCVARIDILRLGHAMIRPTPGFVTSEARRRLANWGGPVQFANSDLSGISIFEEAQYRGVRAADRVLSRLGYRNLEYAQTEAA